MSGSTPLTPHRAADLARRHRPSGGWRQHRLARTGLALLGTSGLLLGLAMSTATAASSHAGSAASGSGSLTATATADGFIVPAAPTRVTGAYRVLMLGASVSDRRTAYLHFDVSGIPAGAVDVQAQLVVTGARAVPSGQPVPTVSAYAVPGTWSESTLDASDAPALGATLGSAPAPGLGSTASIAVGAVADGPVSYALQALPSRSLAVALASRESRTPASLMVTYATPPPPPPHPLFGESVMQTLPTWLDSAAASDVRYGRSSVMRVYNPGAPAPWPGNAGAIGRDVVVSFKIAPSTVLSGSMDSQLSSWFATAPTDRDVYWSYFHEPEDNIAAGEFTAADYRAAWVHLAALARAAGNPHLHATLILMGWSTNPRSGRNVADYYPGPSVVDAVGWDVYSSVTTGQRGGYDNPATIFAPEVAQSAAWGKPFGFAEWGAPLAAGDGGSGRAAWIDSAAAFMTSSGAVFSTYFDSTVGGDYQLRDADSIAALRTVVSGS